MLKFVSEYHYQQQYKRVESDSSDIEETWHEDMCAGVRQFPISGILALQQLISVFWEDVTFNHTLTDLKCSGSADLLRLKSEGFNEFMYQSVTYFFIFLLGSLLKCILSRLLRSYSTLKKDKDRREGKGHRCRLGGQNGFNSLPL